MKYNSQKTEGKYDILLEAKKLAAYTIRITSNEKNFPKRYRLTITAHLQELALQITTWVIMANEIYPNSRRELEERLLYEKQARAACRSLMTLIEVSVEVFNTKASTYETWTASASKLHNQITKWIMADRVRFK